MKLLRAWKAACQFLLPALIGFYSFAATEHGCQHGHAWLATAAVSAAYHAEASHQEADDCSVFHSSGVALVFQWFKLQVSAFNENRALLQESRLRLPSHLIPFAQAPPAALPSSARNT